MNDFILASFVGSGSVTVCVLDDGMIGLAGSALPVGCRGSLTVAKARRAMGDDIEAGGVSDAIVVRIGV